MNAPLDIHRQAALPNILQMLGLEPTRQTRTDQDALLDRFYSIPHAQRRDAQLLADVLVPVETVLQAFGNYETECTVRQSPELQRRLNAISARAAKLATA